MQRYLFLAYFHSAQVFVLMQFDPGLEYKPNRGESAAATAAIANTTAVASTTNPTNKDDPSWLLLCRALTEGPYSYI